MRILIVDDSLMIRQQVKAALTCAEFELVEAGDGVEALEKLVVGLDARGDQLADDRLFEVAVIHHSQCGTSLLADPGFRHQAAEATGQSEAALEASAVADPYVTVKTDVERLLASPSLSPKVSVSGHVYDIATGYVTTTVDARYP